MKRVFYWAKNPDCTGFSAFTHTKQLTLYGYANNPLHSSTASSAVSAQPSALISLAHP